MNRTIRDATGKRFNYESHDQLRQHLIGFVSADNFGRRLKAVELGYAARQPIEYPTPLEPTEPAPLQCKRL